MERKIYVLFSISSKHEVEETRKKNKCDTCVFELNKHFFVTRKIVFYKEKTRLTSTIVKLIGHSEWHMSIVNWLRTCIMGRKICPRGQSVPIDH
jgi:hypothetical protein